ncbi:MAG: ABC transporter permease [Gammaproteobacteria bacterium]|nr:ABC transporter permease [Gammaproteobacteria bacterium]
MRTVLLQLAAKSVLNRRLTAGLTVLSVAVSVALLVGVDRIRTEARAGFANTISGADLIVGARGGPLNLLLYSVFRIGDATSGISWESYEDIAGRAEVAWTIPLSLGDSHRGYRVLGTTSAYFEHYRHGRERRLELAAGTGLADVRDAVLGADVADSLGYAVGDSIVVSHGIGDISFEHHDEMPFTVTGILEPTGTPVDRTVHVTLAGIEAIHDDSAHAPDDGHDDHAEDHGDDHADEHDGHADEHDADHADDHEADHEADHADDHEADHADDHDADHADDHDADHADEHADHADEHADHADEQADHADEHDAAHAADHLEPDSITAFIVGLESRPLLLGLQRYVNEYASEPLMAIIPGVALQQLWEMLGVAEAAMLGISVLVVVAGLIGMLTTFLTSLSERRREMAVLRAAGAGPGLVFALLIVEALLLAAAGSLAGVAIVHAAMVVARPLLLAQFGLALAGGAPGLFDLVVVAAVTIAGGAVAVIPAWRIYRYSLADGLTVRV